MDVIFSAKSQDATINVRITDDNVKEMDEYFYVSIVPALLPENVSIGENETIKVTIVDDESKWTTSNLSS